MVRGSEWATAHLENCLSDVDYETHEFLRRTYRRLNRTTEGIDENLKVIRAGAWRTNEDARRIAEIHVELEHTPAEERLDLLRELNECHERFLEFRSNLKKNENDFPPEAG